MWIVACREYAEDPAFFSLVSPTVFAARRTTIYVFNDRGPTQGVERLALGGESNGGLYTVYRDPDAPTHEIYGDSQWEVLRKLVDERKPKNIAIDISQTHAFSDGLTVGLEQKLTEALGPENGKRVVHAEELALEYRRNAVDQKRRLKTSAKPAANASCKTKPSGCTAARARIRAGALATTITGINHVKMNLKTPPNTCSG